MGLRKHFIFAALVGLATPAWADECDDPYKRTAVSAGKTFTVEFTPRKRDCSNTRCEDNPKETGELKGDPRAPKLALFSIDQRGKKKLVWTKFLAESLEPMGMAVADDGRYVILADTAWCGSGIGDNVVVLLGPGGEQLQNWSLEQLLPADYVEALPQSSPNIHWRGGISYDATAKGFVFQVAIANGKRFDMDATAFVLDPAARSFLPQDKQVWDAALSYAGEVVRNRCAIRQWRLRREAVPLSAPTGTDRTIWQNFAKEIEDRIEFPKDGYVFTLQLFLSAPGDASYQEDLKDFKRLSTILGSESGSDFYLVSPDLKNAAAILKAYLADQQSIDLSKDRFVIAGDDSAAAELLATLATYGSPRVRIISLNETVPPKSVRKDYDWKGKAACEAMAKMAAANSAVVQPRPN